MLKVSKIPSPSSFHNDVSLTNSKMPWLNRRLAILLLTLPFIPALSERKSAYAKEEPNASNPGRIIRNPNEKVEFPSHRQMAMEELLRRDPVFRREAVDIIAKANEIEVKFPYGEATRSDRMTVTKDLFGDPEVEGDRGWYSYQDDNLRSYVRAKDTQDTYKSHSMLPMVLNGAIDFIPRHGTGILKDFVDKAFEHALPDEIAESRRRLKVDMPIAEQAKLILSEYDKGGWTAQLLEETKFFEGIGLDMRATPAEIEEQLPAVKQRIEVREELRAKREELNKLEKQFSDLSEQSRIGNSSVRRELEVVKAKLSKQTKEIEEYTQEILTSSIGELQAGVSKLLAWKRELDDEKAKALKAQEAQDQIDTYYAVIGGLTDVFSFISPEAASIVNGIGNVVGSIMSASLSGFAFGPVVGVVSTVFGFISSLFSKPEPSLAQYIEKRFDRIELMLEDIYKSLVGRLDIIDQKASLLLRFAEDIKDFQSEHRRRLTEIGFGVDRNAALLDKITQRLDRQAKETFTRDVETALRDYSNSVTSGTELAPLKPDPEKWLKDFLDLARQFSSEELFVGSYSSVSGDLDRSIRLRGLSFSEGLIFDAINQLIGVKQTLGVKRPRNGLVVADAVISALKIPETWPNNYPRLSMQHASELKTYLERQLAFYEELTSNPVIETLSAEYEKAVSVVVLGLVQLLRSGHYMQLCGIPGGVDLSLGLDQARSPIFDPKGLVVPVRRNVGFDIQLETLRIALTKKLREKLGDGIDFPPVPDGLKLDMDISSDLLNFNAEHILRTIMGTPVPVGIEGFTQTTTENSLNLKNKLTFILSNPQTITSDRQLKIPVYVGQKQKSIGREGFETENIYHDAFYNYLELNSRITFRLAVSALQSSLELEDSNLHEISQIEFTSDKAYPIARWYVHDNGPLAPVGVPGVERQDNLYRDLCANWNERYNQMISESAEFSMRILQHLVNRENLISFICVDESGKKELIKIGKDTLSTIDITQIKLEVDHNGFHRMLINIRGHGTFVLKRSRAEVLLTEMLNAEELAAGYLNTTSFLPASLNREIDTFDLKLAVKGSAALQDNKTPAEIRYKNLEKRSAGQLLKYREAFQGFYYAMLSLDDRSTLLRAVLGLSIPDEILGSEELLSAVREETGFLTSDYIVSCLMEISEGRMTFDELFKIMINKKTKPITDLKDGLKKIDPKTIKHGITRVREAYALLEDYLQQTNAEK